MDIFVINNSIPILVPKISIKSLESNVLKLLFIFLFEMLKSHLFWNGFFFVINTNRI